MKKTEQIEPQHTAIFVTTSREEGEKKRGLFAHKLHYENCPQNTH